MSGDIRFKDGKLVTGKPSSWREQMLAHLESPEGAQAQRDARLDLARQTLATVEDAMQGLETEASRLKAEIAELEKANEA